MTRRASNIVLIICDDLAWGDLACHGNQLTTTPRLDRLYARSARLTRYCSGPVCTPARAALMTGRHPFRTRAFDTYLGRSIIDPGERTLAAILKDAGYATGIFGKWHLGDCYPSRAIDHGFDEALVHNGGGLRQSGNLGRDSYFDPDLMHNGQIERCQGYCTDIFAQGAIDFIERHQSKPFFCYLATNAPHNPYEIDDEWVEPHRVNGMPETWARIYGMNANIDYNVGRILDKLDQLHLADDTIVMFMSDHGPCPGAQHQRRNRWNADLRGIKGTMYEGGIRVPCFVRYPGRITPGVIDRLANPIDWLPTLANFTGAKVPDDRTIDGVDLTPLFTGETPGEEWPDRTICMQWHRGDKPQRYRNAAVIGQCYKWYQPENAAQPTLYDVINDPSEQDDVSAAHPDLMRKMRERYDAWFDDVSTTRPNNYAPPRIVIGSEHEPVTGLTWQDWRLYDPRDEGWDEQHPGFWEVRVTKTQRYRLTIDLMAGTTGTLRVRCGNYDRRLTSHRAVDSQSVALMAELSAGDYRLEAYLQTPTGRVGVKRVWVGTAGGTPVVGDAP